MLYSFGKLMRLPITFIHISPNDFDSKLSQKMNSSTTVQKIGRTIASQIKDHNSQTTDDKIVKFHKPIDLKASTTFIL